jgi:hypothetical protein
LRRRVRNTDTVTGDAIAQIAAEYDEILQRYSANHEPVDFEKYQLEHPNEYARSTNVKKGFQSDIRAANFFDLFARMVVITVMVGVVAGVLALVILGWLNTLNGEHQRALKFPEWEMQRQQQGKPQSGGPSQ